MSVIDFFHPRRPVRLVDDERFADRSRPNRRFVDAYRQGRPVRRAVLETVLTLGVMALLIATILVIRIWYALDHVGPQT
jgi:hypothetical protein